MQPIERWKLRLLQMPSAVQESFWLWLSATDLREEEAFSITDKRLLLHGISARDEMMALARLAKESPDCAPLWSLLTACVFFEHIVPHLLPNGEDSQVFAPYFGRDGLDWPNIVEAVQRSVLAKAAAKNRARVIADTFGLKSAPLTVQVLTDGSYTILYADKKVTEASESQPACLIALLVRAGGHVPYVEAAQVADHRFADGHKVSAKYVTAARDANRLFRKHGVPFRVGVGRRRIAGHTVRVAELTSTSEPKTRGRPRRDGD